MRKNLSIENPNFFLIVVIAFFSTHIVADFLLKIDLRTDIIFLKFNKWLKAGFLLVSLLYGFTVLYSKVSLKILFLRKPFVYLALFLLFSYQALFFGEALTYLRYIFFIGIVPAYFVLDRQPKFNSNYIEKFLNIIEVLIVINFIIVLIGFFLNSELLSTYRNVRFGFNGILLNQMQTPYLYSSCLFLFYAYRKKSAILITVLLILFSGIKSSYLLLAIFFFFLFIKLKGKIKHGMFFGLLIFVLTVVVGMMFIMQDPVFVKIIDEHNIFTALTSTRDLNLIRIINSIDSTNFNLFIGNIDLEEYRSEFGLLDICFFFGLLGLLFYFYFFKFIYESFVKSQNAKWYYISTIIVISLAGNFLYFPFNCFIFITTLYLLKKKEYVSINQPHRL